MEEYNLLSNKYNCIETSTSIGFIIEEFIVSKLEIYTQNHNNADNFRIKRSSGSTTKASYDCFGFIDDIKVMINIKVDKGGNNAISAIKMLYEDYVLNEPRQEKGVMVLKIHYDFDVSKTDNQKKIIVKDITSFFLEEIDFSQEHKQDNRNWSKDFNPNSGRLQASDTFRQNNKVKENNISYQNTIQMLNCILQQNKKQSN